MGKQLASTRVLRKCKVRYQHATPTSSGGLKSGGRSDLHMMRVEPVAYEHFDFEGLVSDTAAGIGMWGRRQRI